MLKAEMIQYIAEDAQLSHGTAKLALNCILNNIKRSCAKGDKVQLLHFGTFKSHTRPDRIGAHPQTGKLINIKSKKVLKFKPAPGLDLEQNGLV